MGSIRGSFKRISNMGLGFRLLGLSVQGFLSGISRGSFKGNPKAS